MRCTAWTAVLAATAICLCGNTSLAQSRAKWGELETISVKEAEEAAEYSVAPAPLRLNKLTSLSPEAAKSLAKYKGALYLNGLSELSVETARELAQHKGELQLNGVTSLSLRQAEALSSLGHALHLRGVKELTEDVLAALANNKAELALGVEQLSDRGAEALAQHEGVLYLNSLVDISPKGLQALVKHQGAVHLSNLGWHPLSPEQLAIITPTRGLGWRYNADLEKQLREFYERLVLPEYRKKQEAERKAEQERIAAARAAAQAAAKQEQERSAAADMAAQAEHERVVAAIAAKAKQDQALSSAKKSKTWLEWAVGGASSENEKVVGPVESWNRFVDAAKGRASAVEAKWKEDHPEGSLQIKFLSDDVKKTDSLKSPYRGEILLSVINNFGLNSGRQLMLDTLDKSKSVYSALQRSYFENGDQREADRMLKELKDVESRRREVLKQDSSMISGYEYQLRFTFTNGSWVFSDGEQKVTRSCTDISQVGKTIRFNELEGDELEIFK